MERGVARSMAMLSLLSSTLGANLWGVTQDSTLVSIDMKSGAFTKLGPTYQHELEAQEESAIDSKRGRYYTAGLNASDPQKPQVNLCVWDLKSGAIVDHVPLPFESSVFVGVGEALDVDPNDGTIIVMGHDQKRGGHHAVYTMDPDSFKPTFVADLGGDMHSDLLGGSTAYDSDARVAYVMTAVTDATTGQPKIEFTAVDLATGGTTSLPDAVQMAGFAYDSKTKRVYGTTVLDSSGAATAWSVEPRTRRLVPKKAGANGIKRQLAYFSTASRDKLTLVGEPMSLVMGIGDLHVVDLEARVHYSLLMGTINASTFQPTTFCKDKGEMCAAGTSCCCDPTAPSALALAGGKCYDGSPSESRTRNLPPSLLNRRL